MKFRFYILSENGTLVDTGVFFADNDEAAWERAETLGANVDIERVHDEENLELSEG